MNIQRNMLLKCDKLFDPEVFSSINKYLLKRTELISLIKTKTQLHCSMLNTFYLAVSILDQILLKENTLEYEIVAIVSLLIASKEMYKNS